MSFTDDGTAETTTDGYEADPYEADPYEEVRRQLESIAEQLADVALSRLRDQFGGDPAAAKEEEKRVSRARRAVLKAARELEG